MGLREQVLNDEILMIEFLARGWTDADAPSVDFLKEWHDQFPSPKVIVVADEGDVMRWNILNSNGVPDMAIIGKDFKWEAKDENASLWQAVQAGKKL